VTFHLKLLQAEKIYIFYSN